MKIKIEDNSVIESELKAALQERFGDTYLVKNRQKGIIAVAKSKTFAALVVVRKNRIFVNGGFPSMIKQMVFTLIFILLGILIPLILYFIFYHKKMKEIEKEVAGFIQERYQDKIIE